MSEDYSFYNDAISIIQTKWKQLDEEVYADDKEKSDIFEYLEIRGSREYWHDFLDSILTLLDDDSSNISLYFHYANFVISNHGMFIEFRDTIFREYDFFAKSGDSIESYEDITDNIVNIIQGYAKEYTQYYIEKFETNDKIYNKDRLDMMFTTILRIMLDLEMYYFAVLFL